MIEITGDVYRALAIRLQEEIGASDYFNGSVEFESDTYQGRFLLSAIIYRRRETLPEGSRRPVCDVVPTWWEMQTTVASGPVANDFSFSDLRPLLLDPLYDADADTLYNSVSDLTPSFAPSR